ncbi:hypothetical protein AMS68_003452 [Peltaster fructicola]|uniref:Uncharacterized protein n=1 Tax=Peltaster fructicola TaxID=286661 RepID=A0A6H0XTG3_9PEZI|nr:hypothetical protein AMS68_003452 [Peltaster fructicola]
MLDKTSIYACARSVDTDVPRSDSHQYQKPRPKWTIMAEAHSLLGTGNAEVVEYCATWNDKAAQHQIHSIELGSHDSILGSILIAESAHISQKKLNALLQEHYEVKNGSLDADSTSQEWLKHALHVLQEQKVIEKFDVATFMSFAHGYLANRQSGGLDAPATIAYPQLHQEHEKKAKQHGFWVAYPQTTNNRSGDKIYGGLM